MDSASGHISIEESKRRLLEWGGEADEALRDELHEAIAVAKHGAFKALPWAGAALLMGLLTGRRRRAEGEASKNPIRTGIGMLRGAIKIAMFVLPLIRPMFVKPHHEE